MKNAKKGGFPLKIPQISLRARIMNASAVHLDFNANALPAYKYCTVVHPSTQFLSFSPFWRLNTH